jgi:surface antigen
MRPRATGGKWLFLYSLLAVGALGPHAALANSTSSDQGQTSTSVRKAQHVSGRYATELRSRHGKVPFMWCVPFARRESGIEVTGNAWEWWENATGLYERGNVPQVGSVLVFQSNRQMRLGHVAVVTRIISPRQIEIDQANWPHGGIERGMSVVDVSTWNDWTAVRVQIGHSALYGSIYPTYGFIYDRPDRGTVLTATASTAPMPVLNPAPSDLRTVGEDEELAEAPSGTSRHLRHSHRLAHRKGSRHHADQLAER